jgi:regulator of protease activity HflC (stomatin/prohibitin superfamily)
MAESQPWLQNSVERLYAKPTEGHISLGRGLRGVLFLVPTLVLFALLWFSSPPSQRPTRLIWGAVLAIGWNVIVSGVRVAAEWERGVILRLGKLQALRGPGILYVIPVIESVQFVDTRTLSPDFWSYGLVLKKATFIGLMPLVNVLAAISFKVPVRLILRPTRKL